MAYKNKCLYCGVGIDKEKEEYTMVGKRYVHKICFDERQALIHGEDNSIDYSKTKKVDKRVCLYCGGPIDLKQEEYAMVTSRYAHQKCYEKNYSPDEEYKIKIYDLLKKLNIKYDYQQCERQRGTFIKKSGYTNEGIYLALKYFYCVKKQSPEKSGNRIGIVPYVYNEAQEYYKNIEKRQKNISKGIEKQLKDNPLTINITAQEHRKQKEFIDIDKIGEDDDR